MLMKLYDGKITLLSRRDFCLILIIITLLCMFGNRHIKGGRSLLKHYGYSSWHSISLDILERQFLLSITITTGESGILVASTFYLYLRKILLFYENMASQQRSTIVAYSQTGILDYCRQLILYG